MAKEALDEIQTRLTLIKDLDQKLRDEKMHEVGDLQPLFERSLWVFGPEFESLEFTSNQGMTTVIQKIFNVNRSGSRKRPDFVILPDSSVGLYSRDSYDSGHDVGGIAQLVIAEIKRPGVGIGEQQKSQAWKYVKELKGQGLITEGTGVTCYVLGSILVKDEAHPRSEGPMVSIIAMAYDTFIRRAEKRMLGLRQKLQDAPFLTEQPIDSEAFMTPPQEEAPRLPL